MSLLEELLAAAKTSVKEVELPQLGRSAWVRVLNAEEFLAMAAALRELTGTGAQVARERASISLLAFLCDQDGKTALGSLEDAHKLLAAVPFAVANRIITAGQKLNALDDEAAERLEKNLEPSR
jgi:hypothetical protein